MWFKRFKLINKTNLTNDVFELVFEINSQSDFKSGQFITFLLPKTWFGRAYSVLDKVWNHYYFIIKRLENWRWWSKEICDLNVWEELNWVGPTGSFILKKNSKNKLFIWTWTWIVPLYNMIKNNKLSTSKLIWWLRQEKDLYYLNEINDLWVDSDIYLSQEKTDKYNYGRVTDFLENNDISDFGEYYICWNPSMVESVVDILLNKWISNEFIFTEKY